MTEKKAVRNYMTMQDHLDGKCDERGRPYDTPQPVDPISTQEPRVPDAPEPVKEEVKDEPTVETEAVQPAEEPKTDDGATGAETAR